MDMVTAMLPAQWQRKAVELGALRRLRGCGPWFQWMIQ